MYSEYTFSERKLGRLIKRREELIKYSSPMLDCQRQRARDRQREKTNRRQRLLTGANSVATAWKMERDEG